MGGKKVTCKYIQKSSRRFSQNKKRKHRWQSQGERPTTKNIGEVNPCSKNNAYRGKGLRANLSNEINEILANEATKKSSCDVKNINDCQVKSCSSPRIVSRLSGCNIIEGPATVATSKSATVRFFVR